MIKGAIFDVDGTLLDSMPIWGELGDRYLEKKGIAVDYSQGDKLFTMTMEEGAEYFKETYGLKESVQEIIREINQQIEGFYFYEVQLKPGVKEFLDGLKDKGVKLAVATATDRYLIEAAFSRLGIKQYFCNIYTCSEVGAGKEEPKIYHEAAAYMGTSPRETLVFEDALHGIYTCSKEGYKTVALYDPVSEEKQEELRQAAQIYLRQYDAFEQFWQLASA